MTVNFNKTYNSPEDIVELLRGRRLTIDKDTDANEYIRNIGYYRLSGYLYPFLEMPKEKQMFKTGSDFNAALSLYRFDKKLRIFMFNEIEKIEIALRSAVANIVADETDNIFWVTEPSLLANKAKYDKTMSLIDKELNDLLAQYPNIDTRAMGFPDGWEREEPWRE